GTRGSRRRSVQRRAGCRGGCRSPCAQSARFGGHRLGKTGPVNGVLTNLALVMLFVLIGGFFSGSELAVLTLRDSQAERLPGRRGARVRTLRTDPSRFLASVQVG